MGINFQIKDFLYPFSILGLRRTFDDNQWLSSASLLEYQLRRLRLILTHASQTVPYYQKVFREKNIIPDDIRSVHDLTNIPFLTKDQLRNNFASLTARNATKYNPRLLSTSGTTGRRVSFYVDKPSNILEFVYYWRSWGWAGYRLGDRFAELSAEFFTYSMQRTTTLHYYHPFTRRLLVNSLLISRKYLDKLIGLFKRFKPLFLKGLPSNLFMLALLLNDEPDHGISLKGIFSQGENLLPYQREIIEKAFSAKVYDSYGHMERTAAISQCPYGMYHIHADYGLVELAEPDISVSGPNGFGPNVKEIVGTSLYNLSMPLIRYRTGDLVKLTDSKELCQCKRTFPIVKAIIGRDADVIITPEGRAVTAIYTVFDRTPGIVMGQIIQETRG